jgi:hypothetical protein
MLCQSSNIVQSPLDPNRLCSEFGPWYLLSLARPGFFDTGGIHWLGFQYQWLWVKCNSSYYCVLRSNQRYSILMIRGIWFQFLLLKDGRVPPRLAIFLPLQVPHQWLGCSHWMHSFFSLHFSSKRGWYPNQTFFLLMVDTLSLVLVMGLRCFRKPYLLLSFIIRLLSIVLMIR